MLSYRNWIKLGASLAFLVAIAYCTTLSFQVLLNKHDEKAGIVTLKVCHLFLLHEMLLNAANLV
jgi:hypothetical protein